MVRKVYPSDVSREQFASIQPLLESARKKAKPRTVDPYEAFCGVLYVLRGGIQWRMLPEGFPKRLTVYSYWQLWSEEQDSILEQCLKNQLARPAFTMARRNNQASALLMPKV